MTRRKRKRLLEEFYDTVYTVLVVNGGAYDKMRDAFIRYHVEEDAPYHEWRFSGKLGFGGKYRAERNAVDCYQEDETPEILELIKQINQDLEIVKSAYKEAFE